jgi:hypothetical protein
VQFSTRLKGVRSRPIDVYSMIFTLGCDKHSGMGNLSMAFEGVSCMIESQDTLTLQDQRLRYLAG